MSKIQQHTTATKLTIPVIKKIDPLVDKVDLKLRENWGNLALQCIVGIFGDDTDLCHL